MPNLIGGQLIGGGWINLVDITQTINGTASGAFAASYQRGIPIRQCQLVQTYIEKPLYISGLLGAPTSRRISFGAKFAFNIWFDNAIPIEPYGGAAPQLPSFRQRDPFQLVFILGYNPINNTNYKAYYAPRAVADSITPIWDEESNPRKVIGQEITGHTKGWTFMLPDDGIPSDNTTLCGAYLSYLKNGGVNLI